MDATCKTCPFWGPFASCDSRGQAIPPSNGVCRRHPPTAMMTESGGDHPELTHENPEVADFWWCGEHPLRQRDRLAAMAMQGLLHSERIAPPDALLTWADLARDAYIVADAMLAARGED